MSTNKMEEYFFIKRNEMLFAATKMALEVMLSQISQVDRYGKTNILSSH
jgi:hypothetical protein